MRPKTQDEKALSGTIRLDRSEQKRVKIVTTSEIPPPQKYLNAHAKKIYREICEHLLKHKALCKIDTFFVSAIAHAFELYARMAKEIEKPEVGLIQVFDNGVRNFSPEYSIMNREFQRMQAGCQALGLNLKSRDAIIAFARGASEEKPADAVADLFNRKSKTA